MAWPAGSHLDSAGLTNSDWRAFDGADKALVIGAGIVVLAEELAVGRRQGAESYAVVPMPFAKQPSLEMGCDQTRTSIRLASLGEFSLISIAPLPSPTKWLALGLLVSRRCGVLGPALVAGVTRAAAPVARMHFQRGLWAIMFSICFGAFAKVERRADFPELGLLR